MSASRDRNTVLDSSQAAESDLASADCEINPSRRRWNVADLIVLILVLLIGLIHLPRPIYGDQALYIIAARKMANGAVLYKDFLDAKQPGIFVFYWVAGRIFGFNEVGIHAFELLYFMIFSLVLISTLRDYFAQRWVASIAPLLTVGFYYAVAGITHLTQIEGVIGAPVFLSIWFADKSLRTKKPHYWIFASGLMGGLILSFKFVFAPIVFFIGLTVLMYRAGCQRRKWATRLNHSAIFTLGVLTPLLLACLYLTQFHMWGLLYDTFFVYPPRALTLPPIEISRLLRSMRWFLDGFSPLLLLAFLGACVTLKSRRDFFTINLVFWLVSATVVIVLQRRSWWEYHFLLYSIPLGILAGQGLAFAWEQTREILLKNWGSYGRILAAICALFLFMPALNGLLMKSILLARYHFALDPAQRLLYQEQDRIFTESFYPQVLFEVAFLAHAKAQPGPIWVCDDPLYYYLAKRDPAVSLNITAEDLLPAQWIELSQQLQAAKPPYIFVKPFYQNLIQRASPSVSALIEKDYQVIHADETGVWYQHKSAPRDVVSMGASLPTDESYRVRESTLPAVISGQPLPH
jgi:hypothetical protein